MGELKRKKSKIETWKPKDPSQIYVEQDDKLLVCHFDEIFHNSKLAVYNRFIIHKESYKNQLELIVNYTNFFINHYDADLELPTAYCKLKFAIDKEKEYDANSIDSFIDFMYLLLFTPTMVDKIRQLVMDNYVDDIEAPYDTKKKYLKSDKKHLESLEFTNQHVRILLAISFSMKIMAAPMFHFIKLNQIDCGKKTTIIFRFFERLFKIFGYGLDYDFFLKDGTLYKSELPGDQVNEQIKAECLIPIRDGYVNKYECYLNDNGKLVEGYYKPNVINMKNKLYVYVKAKVLEANVSNQVMFSQREILGIDLYTVINQFTNRVIISENMVKYEFGNNLIGFNKTVIKYQLNYFLKEQYAEDLIEITNTRPSDGSLSQIDKLLMNMRKIDEGVTTLADLNIDLTTKYIEKVIDIKVSDEELEYYLKYYTPSEMQIEFINTYLTKYFDSYRDTGLINRRNYVKLMLLIKKKLLLDFGYENIDNGEIKSAALPYLLTGNLSDKVSTRIIRDSNVVHKIENNYMYQNLINNKYKNLESIKPGHILSIISSFVNTRYTYCVYEYPELLGEEIDYPEDKIAYEVLSFLNAI